MTVSFVPSFNQLAEFFRKGFVVEEMMDPKARPGGLPRVCRTNTPLRSPNTAHETIHMSPSRVGKKQERSIPRSAKLNLLESIHDLVKIKHELRSVRDEQPIRAIQTLGLQFVEFFEERWEVYDDAVPD